ncbi:MAG: hypothetical protein ACYDGR_02155 [Candidatus Dormibacteria bacterium]
MKGSKLRAMRLATAVAIGGSILALSAGPAFADSGISYYTGSGLGQAVNLSVAPNAILNVNLGQVQAILNSLPLGVGQTVNNLAGSTLANPTAPISVVVDEARAAGTSAKGTELSDGSASSTPVAIDAASLQSELNLLNAALQNVPAGTAAAVQNALQPVIDSVPGASGSLKPVLDTLNAQLAGLADKLGNPSVNVTHSLTAKFGEEKIGDIVSINQGGILTQGTAYHLDPFKAKAKADQAFANNAVTSLEIAPGLLGALQAPSLNASLQDTLNLVASELAAVENTVKGVAGSAPVVGPSLVGPLGQVTGTVNGATSTVITAGTHTVDLSKVDQAIQQVLSLRNALANLNGLTMNDILSTGPSTALGSLQRVNDQVQATGSSQVAHVDAVKMVNPVIAGLLKQVTGQDLLNQPLVTIDGIRANASVALDGKSAPVTSAAGHLVDVMVLGQKVTTDDLLAPGTSCSISVPGKSTCAGITSVIPDTTNGLVSNLLTVTLTRGAAVYPSTNGVTSAAAKIVTLEVAVDLNLSQLSAVTSKLPALPLSLGAAANGSARLVDLQLGVAAAELSLNPALTCQINCQPKVTPPSTGNNVLILGILALAMAAAGAGIGIRQSRFGKN